jgi:hypothetical protein
MTINKEEFQEWLALPATKEFRRYLLALREAAKEAWAMEGFLNEDAAVSALANAGAIERCKLLAALYEVDFPELADGLNYKEMQE